MISAGRVFVDSVDLARRPIGNMARDPAMPEMSTELRVSLLSTLPLRRDYTESLTPMIQNNIQLHNYEFHLCMKIIWRRPRRRPVTPIVGAEIVYSVFVMRGY